jgi:hypothetical protein
MVPNRVTEILGMSLVTALLAGACGNAADTPGSVDPPPESSSLPPEDQDAPTESPVPSEPINLEPIRLGAVFADLEIVGYNQGDVQTMFELAVERVNEDGGINGRPIELFVETPIPIPSAMDVACVALTEDHQVFAVVGVFLNDSALCYSELHDTILINALVIDEEQLERSTAPLLSVTGLDSRMVDRSIDALLASGDLTPGMRLALHGVFSDRPLHEQYQDALAARGIDVVTSTIGTDLGDDPAALRAETLLFAERWRSEDVDAVMASSGVVAGPLVTVYGDLGIDLPMLLPNGTQYPPDIMRSIFGVPIEPFIHAVALITELPPQIQYDLGINGVRECFDAYTAETGRTVNMRTTPDTDERNVAALLVSCSTVDLFAAVARAAGPELTNESFEAALTEVDDVSVTFVSEGSLGLDKHDYSDSAPIVAHYNPQTEFFEPSPEISD